MYADMHMKERKFEVGDLVFLRLQPYRQTSLKKSGIEKLKPQLYGPYMLKRDLERWHMIWSCLRVARSKISSMYLASRRNWDSRSPIQ
jgi:hypothetical protein